MFVDIKISENYRMFDIFTCCYICIINALCVLCIFNHGNYTYIYIMETSALVFWTGDKGVYMCEIEKEDIYVCKMPEKI